MLRNYHRLLILVFALSVICIQCHPPDLRLSSNESNPTFIPQSHDISNDDRNRTKTRILTRFTDKDGYRTDYNDHDIIFPDAYQVIFEHIPKIESAPKCAEGGTYCEDFDSYPYHILKDVLIRKQVNNDLFGKDEPPDDEKYGITNRNGQIEEFVCVGTQKTIFPKIGKNKNNKWKFIINQSPNPEESEGYVQGVTVEICARDGLPCAIFGDLPNGYKTSCKQKYILRRLMSVTDNGEVVPDSFRLPSACCCSYRKDFDFLRRFGSVEEQSRTSGPSL